MKKIILVITILLPALLYGQDWKMSFTTGGTGLFNTIDIHLDQQNNKYLVGTFRDQVEIEDQVFNSRGLNDILLVKLSENGDFIWAEQIGSEQQELCAGIATDESSIYISGSYKDSLFLSEDTLGHSNNFDTFLAKFDFDKNLIWVKNTGSGLKNQRSNSISLDTNGDLLITGYYQDSVKFETDTISSPIDTDGGYYAKYNPDGDLVWANSIIGDASALVFFTGSASFSDVNYFLGYWKENVEIDSKQYTSLGNQDIFVFKTDGDGNILWTRTISGSGSELSYSLTNDKLGNVILGGLTYSSNLQIDSTSSETSQKTYTRLGSSDMLFIKYSLDGTLDWAKLFGTVSEDKVNFVFADQDIIHFTGSYTYQMTFGETTIESNGTLDNAAFLAGIGTDGTPTYIKNINGTGSDIEEGVSIGIDDSKNIYLAGISKSAELIIGDSTYTNATPGNNMGFIAQYGCLPININTETPLDISCNSIADGSLTVDADGGFSTYLLYSVDGGATYEQNGGVFADLTPGDYNVMVKDTTGCELAGGSHSLTEPGAIVITALDSTLITCNGLANGSINITVEGGTSPYDYSNDGGTTYSTIETLSNLAPGTYDVAVQDANDCVLIGETVSISEPDALAITALDSTLVTCNGLAEGSIEVTVTGGTAPYEYSNDGGTTYSTIETLSDLAAGTYDVAVQDANDCVLIGETVSISEPEVLEISLVSQADITNEADGGIVVEGAGGTEPYTFTLTPSAGTQSPDGTFTLSGGDGGSYTVEVDDANNCGPVSTSTITIADHVNIANMTIREGTIYPNPSNGIITVEFNTEKPKLSLEVYSIKGNRVIHKQVFSNGGAVNETFNMSSFAKGTYLIRVDGETLSSGVILK